MQEYTKGGHVDPQLVNDIARWVKALP